MSEQYTMLIPPGDQTRVQSFENELACVYKIAFAGEPWYEKTLCVDDEKRCRGGFSPLAIGETCSTCTNVLQADAYDEVKLTEQWRQLAKNRPTVWYVDMVDERIALAAIFWRTDARLLARERYANVPAMAQWLAERYGEKPFIWLDDIFANKAVRASGNLQAFGAILRETMEVFELDRVAYRTITPQMKRAASKLGVLPLTAFKDVPDRRDFIEIERGNVR